MKKLFILVFLAPFLAFAGANPVKQNTYTTNDQTAADAYVLSQFSGPTNGTTSGTVSNIVNLMRPASQWTTNAAGATLDGGGLTNLNATKLVGVFAQANMPAVYDLTNAAKAATNGWPWMAYADPVGAATAVTNGFPWSSLYDAAGTARAATNALGTAAYRAATSFDAAGAATAATNGYPWGSLYAPATSTNLNSYTTNFTIPTSQTAWTVVIPASATNYLVCARLYLVAKTANPSGITLPQGGLIDCSYVIGTLFPAQPYAVIPQGDGKTFVVSMDGDKANFLDGTGQPYSFSQANVAAGFNLQAVFTWTIHR